LSARGGQWGGMFQQDKGGSREGDRKTGTLNEPPARLPTARTRLGAVSRASRVALGSAMRRPVALTVALALWGCGIAVSPSGTDALDATAVVDTSATDVRADESAADHTDAGRPADALDASTSLDARPVADVAPRDTALPPLDGPECTIPGDINGQCQRRYGLRTSDPAARFACCDGRCQSGACEPLEAGRLPECRGAPCDIREGQLCCPREANEFVCVPRDRGLCR
jgi:hypothetical protein